MINDRAVRKSACGIVCAALAAGIAFGAGAERSLAAETASAKPTVPVAALPAIPAEQIARYQKYLGLIQPTVKSWADSQAQLVLKSASPDLSALTAAIHTRFDPSQPNTGATAMPGALSGSDIAALAFIVLMDAAKSAQDDLKQIMDVMQAVDQAKNALRAQLETLNSDTANSAGKSATAPCATAACMSLQNQLGVLNGILTQAGQTPIQLASGPVTYGAIGDIVKSLQNELDSMSELGETESLRLQMAMDRLSKLMTVLSNVLKSIDDTSNAIVGNLK